MVALNACRSGREAPIEAQILSTGRPTQATEDLIPAQGLHTNLARAFVECDIPSVIAMSYKVTASFVSIFYKSFYNALLKSDSSVAEAVGVARQVLIKHKDRNVGFGVKVELEDWIIPVLYESHTLTFDIASAAETRSTRKSVTEHQYMETISTDRRLFRNVFNPGSLTVKQMV